MIRYLLLIFVLFGFEILLGQDIDQDLLRIKQRMDSIEEFTANLVLDLDVDFINMPTKRAEIHYVKDKPVKFSSDDFVLIPKRGLDFSMNEIFKYPFITVDRGPVEKDGRMHRLINVIPTDKKADYAIATLMLDTVSQRIIESEINTKKDGSYTLTMHYQNDEQILPSMIVVSFEINRIKIPLNYTGKGAEIDKEKLKSDEPKTGKIILKINDYKIRYSG
jgi:hypothetical protein